MLISRLQGRRVAIERIDSGVGPRLWTGAFTDSRSRRPPTLHMTTERRAAASLGQLIETLDGFAADPDIEWESAA